MNSEQYIKAVKALNEAAMCFAILGYMVETTLYSNYVSMTLTIFFYNAKEKKKLDKILRRYKLEDDIIESLEHKTSNNNKFYTLRLIKKSQ